MIFYGTSKELTFKPDNKRAWLDFLESNEGKKLIVDIDLDKAKRSLGQNDYLWGVVYKLIADHTGHSEQEIHEYMKRVCLPPKFKTILGKEMKLPASTAKLNKAEFGIYIEKIKAEVSSLGIIIPDPEPKVKGPMPEYPKEDNQIKGF